jgi:ribosomal protein L18
MATSRCLRRRNGAAPPVRRHDQIIAQIVEQKEGRTLSADEAHKKFVEEFFSSGNEEHEGSSAIEQTGAYKVSLIDPV